ncbi:hypothetical protein COL11_26885 [Bacillus anthracis]|uniref:hypothetical protein n=1 Tax=Bacillus cereus group TaxID=86661 RepID=UPI000BF8692B|nr:MULTISPECIES: hypothetical protein [Bacillus cereus group]PEZ22633.1 hypothetical protein CN337_12810 [Bacillus anthracis]PFF05413.1 hypothetical protein CN315_23875 [Bacillus cereus]PFR93677.1 hypothetical protein COK43_04765 [Bacillus cereus]PFW31778.1 hypothetical protein COL11_26885 [Bacillus anthracis]PGK07387.1 hypothetical protein CN892_12890 [Bacillus anthracis]
MRTKLYKKAIPVMLIGGVLSMGFSEIEPSKVSAATPNNLTPEQSSVIEEASQSHTEEVYGDTPQLDPKLQRAASSTKRVQHYRGGKLAWSKDFVEFTYGGGVVSKSTGWQEAGWIFPNIVRKNGITRYHTSKPVDRFRASKTIGAGTVTPWGDVTLYNQDFTDYIHVHGNGSYYVN